MNRISAENIENIIGYAFKDKRLLERAFIHASYAHENGVRSYERLEFLGDGVLGLIIAEILYSSEGDEGVMTVRRSMIVSTEPLEDATLAARLDRFVLYGNGEKAHDHSDSKVLADVFEALLGAIYLDGGYAEAVKFVRTFLGDRISDVMAAGSPVNHKGRLQEYCQAKKIGAPKYLTLSERFENGKPVFTVSVTAGGITAEGEGRRKRDAEQKAAKSALEKLVKNGK